MAEHLDSHLVRVPFEALKRAAKNRKAIIDSISDAATSTIDGLVAAAKTDGARGAMPCLPTESRIAAADGDQEMENAESLGPPAIDAMQTDDAPPSSASPSGQLEGLLVQLTALAGRLSEASTAEAAAAEATAARLRHLASLSAPPCTAAAAAPSASEPSSSTAASTSSQGTFLAWNRDGKRLTLLLADHLLRSVVTEATCAVIFASNGWTMQGGDLLCPSDRRGYPNSASQLIHEAGLQGLCDKEIFGEAREVSVALGRRDCSVALQWCADNRARLKKVRR